MIEVNGSCYFRKRLSSQNRFGHAWIVSIAVPNL